jgi:hypothetical protein
MNKILCKGSWGVVDMILDGFTFPSPSCNSPLLSRPVQWSLESLCGQLLIQPVLFPCCCLAQFPIIYHRTKGRQLSGE